MPTALSCWRSTATCSSHPQAEFLKIVGHIVLEGVTSMIVFLNNLRIIPLQGVRVPLIALMLLVEDFILRFAQHEKAPLSQQVLDAFHHVDLFALLDWMQRDAIVLKELVSQRPLCRVDCPSVDRLPILLDELLGKLP